MLQRLVNWLCVIALLCFVIIPKLQEVTGMAVEQLDKVLR